MKIAPTANTRDFTGDNPDVINIPWDQASLIMRTQVGNRIKEERYFFLEGQREPVKITTHHLADTYRE